MTGMIILSDFGQNYIEFYIIDNIIQAVRPAELAGWIGTQILNNVFTVGEPLEIDLQWKDYDFPLRYSIVNVIVQDSANLTWLKENMSAEPKPYEVPQTGITHMAYEVDCEGIPFYFDDANNAAAEAAAAIRNTSNLPSVLSQYIDGAQLVDEPLPDSPDTIATIQYGIMTIYGNRTINYGIVAHEAAHPFAIDKWGAHDPPDTSDYMATINSDELPISPYAHTDPSEDFAESVRMYATDPELMKRIAPLRYDVVDKLMKDPDYAG